MCAGREKVNESVSCARVAGRENNNFIHMRNHNSSHIPHGGVPEALKTAFLDTLVPALLP